MTYTLIVLRIGHFYNLKTNLSHSISQQRLRIKDTRFFTLRHVYN